MEIDLSVITHTIKRLFWVPAVAVILLGSLGFGVGSVLPDSYNATTQLLVTQQISGSSVLAESGRPETFVNLVTSGPVLDRVIIELELDLTREDLADMITATVVPGTQIIEISVDSSDPQLAADIANALSRNMVSTASELSIGELQRNLDDMKGQAESAQNRITVIDTRLAEIDVEANAENAELQAEIAQLKRDRLQLSQTSADLDAKIRQLTTELSSASIPVVTTDFAKAPTESNKTSPILLGILGIFIGAIVGAAIILYVAVTDEVVRNADQVKTGPVLGTLSKADVESGSEATLGVNAGKIVAFARAAESHRVSIVSPRENGESEALAAKLKDFLASDIENVDVALSALDKADSLKSASAADLIVVIAEVGFTKVPDLSEVKEFAELVGTRIAGTILIK